MHEADGEGREEEGDRQVITKRTMRRGRWPERIQRDVRGAIGRKFSGGQPVGAEPWREWRRGGVASSGWGAVATLTASNVVARVALFGQAPYYGSS